MKKGINSYGKVWIVAIIVIATLAIVLAPAMLAPAIAA